MSTVSLNDEEVVILKLLTAKGQYKNRDRAGHIWHTVRMLSEAMGRGRHYIQPDVMDHLTGICVVERGTLRGNTVYRITPLGLQELKSRG